MKVYLLRDPEMPWGDYGQILASGMTSQSRRDGLYQLERTGPFVPPISMPLGAIIVTDEFRLLLEKTTLTGFTFQPVIKSRIVRLDWQDWDRTAEDPEEYPATGEPEDYILEQPHLPDMAKAIGNLWELCLGEHAELIRTPKDLSTREPGKWSPNVATHDLFVVQSSWDGTDWFKAKRADIIFISERTKAWLEQTVREWVSFEPALIK